jgi:hypothetical protein
MKYRWAIHSRETGELSSLSTFHRKGWAINWHATFGDGSLFRTAMPHGVGLKLFLAQHFPFVPLRVQVCVVQHKTCHSLLVGGGVVLPFIARRYNYLAAKGLVV